MNKKVCFLTLFLLSIWSFQTKAQLNPGDTAPDWTMTDINGDTYHLYEILDQGKNVIIDFSATWCPPCWSFHTSGILEHLYETYGPDGTDELMVFFVEGDVTTTSADLHGTGNRTRGDWVTGTPYPIFDITSQQILVDYKIPYWPTVYTICNDKKIKVQGRFSIAGFESYLNSCPEPVPPLEITNTEINNASCSNSEDGSISLSIEGPNPPFTVYWSDGSNSNGVLENIPPGNYNATIIDYSGNYIEVGPFHVGYDQEGVTGGIVEIRDANCTDGLGSIDIEITSGTAVSYQWSNGATTQDVEDLSPGVYSLTITGDGGCEQILDELTVQGANIPSIDLDAIGQLNCNESFIEIDASNSILQNGDIISWTTDDGHIVANENTLTPQVDQSGTYTLTITNAEGCSAESSIYIENPAIPNAIISETDEITCNVSCITLDASNSTSGDNIEISWDTNDGAFSEGTSSLTPTVCQAGSYELIITNTDNGCSQSTTVNVTENNNPPEVGIIGATELNCNESRITLSSSSNNTEFSYTWSDNDGNVVSTENSINIENAGIYTLDVTDQTTGCHSSSTVEISSNTQVPDISELMVSNDITCSQNNATISANIQNGDNTTYHWITPSGETIDSESSTLEVSSPGVYQLVVENKNGCTSQSEIEVVGSSDTPQALATSGTISCQNTEITLSGSSNLDNTTFHWEGPNGFSSDEQNPTVTMAGEYILTVMASNGCSSTTTTTVDGNTEMPVITNISGFSNCSEYGLEIDATGTNLSYLWTGPNGFTSTAQNPEINEAIEGEFTCVITNEYGCSTEASTMVIDQSDIPTITSTTGVVNCTTSNLSIQIEGDPTKYSYQWTGPNGFTSTAQNPEITDYTDGEYSCVVTSSTGCTSESVANVTVDTNIPEVEISSSNDIDCSHTSATLSVSTSETDLNYTWVGPNNFTANQENVNIESGGEYTLTVVNPENGCSSESRITIAEHTDPIEIQLEKSTLSCDKVSVNLPDVIQDQQVSWTNEAGDVVGNEVTSPGTYTGTFIDNFGCEGTATQYIEADTEKPIFELNGTKITCKEGKAILSIDAQSAIRSVAWSGPGITPANKYQVNPEVTVSGTYVADVTGENGCSLAKDKEIEEEPKLDMEVKSISNISCFGAEDGHVELDLITGTPPLSYDFDVSASLQKGTYFVNVTDSNGCKDEVSFTIAEPTEISISFEEVTNNSDTKPGQAKAVVNGGTPPYTYLWDDGTTNDKNESLDVGLHTVSITDANGCTQEESITIEQATGIDKIESLNSFEITPNPSNGLFSLRLEFATKTNFRIEVLSVLGQTMYTQDFVNKQHVNQSMDLDQLQSGSYLLKIITSDGHQAIQKINIFK